MKRTLSLIAVALLAAASSGCISSKFIRMIPENKDADIEINSIYGRVVIHSRVNPLGSNALLPLPNPGAVTVLTNSTIFLSP